MKKFGVVAAFTAGDASEVVERANRIFEFRNSLAHFKESYDEVAGPYPLDMNLDEWLGQLPETELITKLKPPKLESTIEDIVSTRAWLDEGYESVFKGSRRKIDRTRE